MTDKFNVITPNQKEKSSLRTPQPGEKYCHEFKIPLVLMNEMPNPLNPSGPPAVQPNPNMVFIACQKSKCHLWNAARQMCDVKAAHLDTQKAAQAQIKIAETQVKVSEALQKLNALVHKSNTAVDVSPS